MWSIQYLLFDHFVKLNADQVRVFEVGLSWSNKIGGGASLNETDMLASDRFVDFSFPITSVHNLLNKSPLSEQLLMLRLNG